MPRLSFSHYSGPYDLDSTYATKASTALDSGDALKEDTGLGPATSGAKVVAVAIGSKASSVAAQTPIQTLTVFSMRTRFYGTREAGTLAVADERGLRDLNSADGFDADASTNDDLFIHKRLDADAAVVLFADPANLHATN